MKYVLVKRSGLVLLAIVCLAIGSCLSCGCMIDAGKLAGFSQPKLRMAYDHSRGRLNVEAGTDFQGRAEGHYDPETNKVDAIVEVGSQASPVVTAEGNRAEHLVALRKIEADMLIAMHELVGKNMLAVGDMARDVGSVVTAVKRADNEPTLLGSLWMIVKVLIAVVVATTLAKMVWGYFVKPVVVVPGSKS